MFQCVFQFLNTLILISVKFWIWFIRIFENKMEIYQRISMWFECVFITLYNTPALRDTVDAIFNMRHVT